MATKGFLVTALLHRLQLVPLGRNPCPDGKRNEDSGATDYVPALLAPFRSIDGDSITAIQRIALNSDGTKRGRRMLGIVRRAAIKFDDIGPSGELVVGEERRIVGRRL
jgi:hypothetical protein